MSSQAETQTDRGADEAVRHYHYSHGSSGGIKRSDHWPHVRDQFLKANPVCAVTGAIDHLEVHHIIPFHLGVLLGRGYIELDTRNLIVLAREPLDAHMILGHLDDFRSWNPHLLADIAHAKTLTSLEDYWKDEAWLFSHLHRPRPWDHMTEYEKTAVRHLIDKLYPIGSKK